MLQKRKPFIYLLHRFWNRFSLDVISKRVIVATGWPGTNRGYGIDLSHWEGLFNPDQAAPGLIDFVIFKATEGTSWVDSVFDLNYSSAVGRVPILGAYHYLRSGYSAKDQANHFLNVIDGKDLDIIAADFESTNNTMNDSFVALSQEFGLTVSASRPDLKLLFYTNPSTYDNVVFPGSNRLYGEDVFNNIPWDGLWIAQYYFTPDPNKDPSMPKSRDDWAFWQYSEAGDPDLHGTQGFCDQDVYNGTITQLNEWLDNSPDPPDPPPGVEMYIYKVPQSDIVRAFVTGYSQRKTVAQAAADFHATCQPGNHSLVINGDGWDNSTGKSKSIWYSDGIPKNTDQLDWRPRAVFDNHNLMTLRFKGQPYYYPDNRIDWNTFSLTRRLVIEGKINPAFIEGGELNARCGFGITANREFVIVGADGWDKHHLGLPPSGVTITDIGNALISQGVIEGGDGDGGGSFTLAWDGEVINGWYNDGYPMRAVVNHLCLEIKGQDLPPTGEIAYLEGYDSDGNKIATFTRQVQ